MGGCCGTEKVEKQPIHSIIQNPIKEMEHNPVRLEKDNGNSDLGANEKPTNGIFNLIKNLSTVMCLISFPKTWFREKKEIFIKITNYLTLLWAKVHLS